MTVKKKASEQLTDERCLDLLLELTQENEALKQQKDELSRRVEELTQQNRKLARENEILRVQRTTGVPDRSTGNAMAGLKGSIDALRATIERMERKELGSHE